MKVKHLLPPVLLFCALRVYIIIKLTQEGSGFLPRGHVMSYLYPLALVALCIYVRFFAFKGMMGGQITGDCRLLYGGMPAVLSMLFAALGFGLSGYLMLANPFSWSFILLVLCGLSAIVMLLLAPASSGKRSSATALDSYLELVIVAWALVSLLSVFLANNTVTTIPGNMLSLLSVAALATAIFCEAKLRGGLMAVSEYTATMAMAAIICTTTQLPAAISVLLGYSEWMVSKSWPVDVAVLFLIPMMWVNLFAAERAAKVSE